MPRLPQVRRIEPEGEQVIRLARWLCYWKAAQIPPDESSEAQGDADEAAEIPDLPTPVPFDSEPAAEQIRLMAPTLLGPDVRDLYVLVIGVEASGEWRVVPFGPFPEPATPDEIATGRREPGLRVLCVWNARTLSASIIAQSWVADDATAEEMVAVRDVLSARADGRPIPPSMKDRIGPPILRIDDPRWDYMAQEGELMDGLATPETRSERAPDPWLASVGRRIDLTAAARDRVLDCSDVALQAGVASSSRVVVIDISRGDPVPAISQGELPPLCPKQPTDHPRAVVVFPPQPAAGRPDVAFAQWRIEGRPDRLADGRFLVFSAKSGRILGAGSFSSDGSVATLESGPPAPFHAERVADLVLLARPK